MQEHPHEGLAATFDTAAELYEQSRPGYPPQLFDDLAVLLGAAARPVRALEIGAGTGQATRGLLARGWGVVALEPGRELARVAHRVLAGRGDVEIVGSTFEQWRGDDASFDLVLAATSWHWLDPTIAYAKAARLLRSGGTLAVVATAHVLPTAGGDSFFWQVEDTYNAVGMGDGRGGPPSPDRVLAPDVASIDDRRHGPNHPRAVHGRGSVDRTTAREGCHPVRTSRWHRCLAVAFCPPVSPACPAVSGRGLPLAGQGAAAGG